MASLVCHLSGSGKEHLHQLRYQSGIQKQSHCVTGKEEHSKEEKKNSEPSMGSNRLKVDEGLSFIQKTSSPETINYVGVSFSLHLFGYFLAYSLIYLLSSRKLLYFNLILISPIRIWDSFILPM